MAQMFISLLATIFRGNDLEFVILDLFGIWCLEFRILFKIRAATPYYEEQSL